MKTFYVYQLRAENEVLPFYIGKGTGYRMHVHFCPASLKQHNFKSNKIKSLQLKNIKVIAEKLYISECEESCLEMEIFLIALYGRQDNKIGVLTNLTDGGDKGTGAIKSEEVRRKIADNRTYVRKYSIQEITEHYNKCRMLGISQKQYCINNNISYYTFTTAVKRLKLTNDKRTFTTDEFKTDHINRFLQSNLTIKDYAIQNNIHKSNLGSWLRSRN